MAASPDGPGNPPLLRSLYQPTTFHEPIPLFRGQMMLKDSGSDETIELDGGVELVWLPTPTVRYVVWSTAVHVVPEILDPCSSSAPDVSVPAGAWAQPPPSPVVPPEGVTFTSRGRCPRVEVGDGRALKRVVFHLVNFTDFLGSHGTEDGGGWRRNRLELSHGVWRIRLDSRMGIDAAAEHLAATGGFAFTHIGEITRADGANFAAEEIKPMLSMMHWFAALARGAHAGVAIPVGFGDTPDPAWVEWSATVADPWRGPLSWASRTNPEQVQTAFSLVMDRMEDPFWSEVLRLLIDYYVAANDPRPVEQALMVAQAGLELTSWLVLVKLGDHCPKETEQMKAAARLRRFLSALKVDCSIPPRLASLSGLRLGDRPDGPGAITGARNRIVHPSLKKATLDTEAKLDVWRLALWYLELGILYLIGYEGEYTNRVTAEWVGETELVPWAK